MNAQPVETIILANNREFFASLDSHLPGETSLQLKETDFSEVNLALFWARGSALVIVPKEMNAQFVRDIKALLYLHDIVVLHPKSYSQSLCNDILLDSNCYQVLAETIRASDCPQVITWGSTPDVFRLKSHLDAEKLIANWVELPQFEVQWAANFVGSKSGFRQLLHSINKRKSHIRIPEGYICADREEALGVVDFFLRRGKSSILKPNRSFGGWGSCVFSVDEKSETPTHKLAQLESAYGGLITGGTFVVEEFIQPIEYLGEPLIPTVNALITSDDRTAVQFLSRMRIADSTKYWGVEIGYGSLPKEIENAMVEIAVECGAEAAKLGYRGWFDVDLIVGNDGYLYCTEMNARRTSPVYAFEIWRKLSKLYDREDLYLSSNDHASLPSDFHGVYAGLRQALIDLYFPINGQPRGIIICMATPVDEDFGYTGYVAIGGGREDVAMLEAECLRILANLGGNQ